MAACMWNGFSLSLLSHLYLTLRCLRMWISHHMASNHFLFLSSKVLEDVDLAEQKFVDEVEDLELVSRVG